MSANAVCVLCTRQRLLPGSCARADEGSMPHAGAFKRQPFAGGASLLRPSFNAPTRLYRGIVHRGADLQDAETTHPYMSFKAFYTYYTTCASPCRQRHDPRLCNTLTLTGAGCPWVEVELRLRVRLRNHSGVGVSAALPEASLGTRRRQSLLKHGPGDGIVNGERVQSVLHEIGTAKSR